MANEIDEGRNRTKADSCSLVDPRRQAESLLRNLDAVVSTGAAAPSGLVPAGLVYRMLEEMHEIAKYEVQYADVAKIMGSEAGTAADAHESWQRLIEEMRREFKTQSPEWMAHRDEWLGLERSVLATMALAREATRPL